MFAIETVENPMQYTETELKGVYLLTPFLRPDERGWFAEVFKQEEFETQIGPVQFMQENQSFSKKGVLRGLHQQLPPYAQAKLVRCVQGRIWDVAVDVRADSAQFGRYFGVELSEENQQQLFVPKGFLHGFLVLSDSATVQYKVDAPYHQPSETGIRFDDPALGIAWPMSLTECIVSPKDLLLPYL